MKTVKSILCTILSAFLLVSYLPFTSSFAAREEGSRPGRLIVNGIAIETEDAEIHVNQENELLYYTIPLFATLKALGGHVIKISDSKTLILYRGFLLHLKTEQGTIYLFSKEGDYFSQLGGIYSNPNIREKKGDDYVIDSFAAESLFELLEVSARCDLSQSQITIQLKSRIPGIHYAAQLCFLAAILAISLPRTLFEIILDHIS